MSVPVIAVLARHRLPQHYRLFEAIGCLYGIRFVPTADARTGHYGAAVMLGFSRSEALEYSRDGIRCLAYLDEGPLWNDPGPIRFSDSGGPPEIFRAASLDDPGIGPHGAITPQPGDAIIAERSGRALWIRAKAGSAYADLTSVSPPQLGDSEFLYSRFGPENWFGLLPLMILAKEVAGWGVPPVRACFMLDDPNLHRPSYGYLDYRDLASDAAAYHYHVAVATIPIDGWLVSSEAAQVFRDRRSQLSLLVHGNNHTYHELSRRRTPASREALAAQALQRVERIERKSGVCVDRIMAAPHGACSESMADVLLKAGFEAACISRSSLMARNRNAKWPPSVGLTPAEFFGGLPVIPRFSIQSEPGVRGRLAAFLGQPVVMSGHHDDAGDGMELLHDRSQQVNRLGSHWTNVSAIARSNYWTRIVGGVLHVRMYSRTVEVPIPPGVTHLIVDRPWVSCAKSEALIVEGEAPGLAVLEAGDANGLFVRPNTTVVLRGVCREKMAPRSGKTVWTPPAAVARRGLCELRDRLAPLLRRVVKLG